MGSPSLLAQGAGQPVANAATTVTVKSAGSYHVWVRTKNWAPGIGRRREDSNSSSTAPRTKPSLAPRTDGHGKKEQRQVSPQGNARSSFTTSRGSTLKNLRMKRFLYTAMLLSYEQRNHASIFRNQDNVAYHNDDRLLRVTKLTSTDAALDLELLWKSSPAGCAVAIWAETKSGSIIETLYLTGSLKYSEFHPWEQGAARRGVILPVWRHRYTAVCGVDPSGVADLVSQSTINHQWLLDHHLDAAAATFVLFAEVNRPNDDAPSPVYAASIDPESLNPYTLLTLVGHSKGSEKDGELNYDLSVLPADSQIVERILVKTTFAK